MLLDAIGKVKILAFAERELHLDRIELRNGRQQRSVPDQVADLSLRDPGDAVDWRRHLAPIIVQLRVLDRGFCRLHRRRRGVRRLIDVVVVLPADHLLLVEGLVPRDILLGLFVVSLLFREFAKCLIEGGFVLSIVYLEQQLAGLHMVAVRVILFQQVAGDLRINIRVDETFSRADPLGIDRHVFLDDGGDDYLRRRRRKRVCSLFAADGAKRQTGCNRAGRDFQNQESHPE